MLTPLPVDPFIPQIQDALKAARAVIVTAPPGAGKTTRVPPALVPDGAVIVLEPRRVAARALAQHVAAERGWTIGREIGWHVRFERRFGPDTRLLVATEGILTARLQRDPLLADFRTIVLDEFHERSVHGDLALALARQAWKARDDLRIVVMSATVDAQSVAEFLGGCPIVHVESRLYPLDISYTPQQPMTAAASELLTATTGDVLCFLPGVAEIQRTIAQLQPIIDRHGVDILPLHGSLAAAEQDAAVRRGVAGRRRVIVATNVAETSLTVPGVTGVVDSGLCKVARYDADRAIDSLTTERISQDSADQRAGRAGRTAAGQVRRLWEKHDRLRPHTEPEMQRIDLSSVALDVLAWGGDPRDLEWFDPPSSEALDAAIALLRRLGAVSGRQLTATGLAISRLPLHPRLACMLHEARGARAVARVCALLSDRQLLLPKSAATTSSDLLCALDRWMEIPPHVDRVARQLEQLYESVSPAPDRVRQDIAEADFRRAVLAGYPDRIGQRREAGSPRVRLATGSGAVLSGESGVRDGEFMVAVDLRAQPGEARIRIASRVEREWLTANAIELVHTFDAASGVVRAAKVEKYDALILRERTVSPEPEEAARLLADAWLSRGGEAEDEQLLRRLRFAGHDVDLVGAVRLAAYGRRALADVKLSGGLPADVLRTLDSAAPRTLSLPSGKVIRLEYLDDGRVKASARLQDVFGLFETPRLGPAREPVLFALLAPNGRPVQLTTDLRSFWERTYPEVRKELRGRYPKHRWPEHPFGPAPKAPAT